MHMNLETGLHQLKDTCGLQGCNDQ